MFFTETIATEKTPAGTTPEGTIPSDIYALFKNEPYSCLLESASHICELGWLNTRKDYYSLIGIRPFLVFSSKKKRITIEENGRRTSRTGNPFSVLKDLFRKYKVPASKIPSPFTCGAVGFFGYDLCHFVERLPSTVKDDLGSPDCIVCFYDPLIIYNHTTRTTHISSTGMNPDADYIAADIKDAVRHMPSAPPVYKNRNARVSTGALPGSNFTKRAYCAAVKQAKEYIAAGDIFQVNLSQRFHKKYAADTFTLYRKLRAISPAPFSAYLNFGKQTLISSSPERFLKLSDRQVETRPMKGTRPRGSTIRTDLQQKKELLNSAKDKAELVMIVDLMRNDLGRVCSYKSINVKEIRTIEPHPTVFQTTSTVTGTLTRNRTCIDLLKACFPGGSITGCPKIRSMEIIDELEPTKRNAYTGALGFIGFDGTMDLSIVIRTIICNNNTAYVQVGGGIVADSVPVHEYEETLNKAKAMLTALC